MAWRPPATYLPELPYEQLSTAVPQIDALELELVKRHICTSLLKIDCHRVVRFTPHFHPGMENVQAAAVPAFTTLSTSAPNCSREGIPPFTVTTIHECATGKPFWALIHQYTNHCTGIEIRDPSRNGRRIGPDGTSIADDEGGSSGLTPDDTDPVRFEPGHPIQISYTFSVVRKVKGLRNSDIWNLAVGNNYILTLRRQKWRWMFEDDMPKESSVDERRELLRKQPVTEWEAECSAAFEFTE